MAWVCFTCVQQEHLGDRRKIKTPWLFITHSLSGTVCKDALRLIGTDRGRTDSAKSTAAGVGGITGTRYMRGYPASQFMVIKAMWVLTGHTRSIYLTVKNK